MIIDSSDFTERPYKIPNQQESRDLVSFLAMKEEELAINYILGKELWELFKAGIAVTPTPDAIWTTLRDGGSYTLNGKNYYYKGWVDMVRPGVYAEWLPQSTFKNTNVGIITNNTPDKATQTDQYPFYVQAWNQFVYKCGRPTSYCWPYGGGVNQLDSFYGWMKANEDSYPTWRFNAPEPINRMDF